MRRRPPGSSRRSATVGTSGSSFDGSIEIGELGTLGCNVGVVNRNAKILKCLTRNSGPEVRSRMPGESGGAKNTPGLRRILMKLSHQSFDTAELLRITQPGNEVDPDRRSV